MSDTTAAPAQCHCFDGTAVRGEHAPYCVMYVRDLERAQEQGALREIVRDLAAAKFGQREWRDRAMDLTKDLDELRQEAERLRADAAYGQTAMDSYAVVQRERDRLRRIIVEVVELDYITAEDIRRWKKAIDYKDWMEGLTPQEDSDE